MDSHRQIIDKHLESQDYEQLIADLESLINNSTRLDDTVFFYLGLAYLLMGYSDEAERVWLSFLFNQESSQIKKKGEQLIEFLELQTLNLIDQEEYAQAKSIYQSLHWLNENYSNPSISQRLIERLLTMARQLQKIHQLQSAIDVYWEISEIDPQLAQVWYELASCYHAAKQWNLAEEAITNALAIMPDPPEHNYLMATIQSKLGKNPETVISFYQRALYLDPKHFKCNRELGEFYLQRNLTEECIQQCKKALQYYPNNSSILDLLARGYEATNNQDYAYLFKAYSIYYQQKSGCWPETLTFLKKINYRHLADNFKWDNFQYYSILTSCLKLCNHTQEYIQTLEEIQTKFLNNDLVIQRLIQVALPVIYANVNEVSDYRHRFSQLARRWVSACQEKIKEQESEVGQLVNSALATTNFYLGYQAQNDLEIQRLFGIYFHQLWQYTLPCTQKSIRIRPLSSNRRFRIGFLSSHFANLGILYFHWVEKLDSKKFEVIAYNLGEKDIIELPELTQLFRESAQQFKNLAIGENLNTLCQQIIDDELDVLIYPEVGLDSIFNCLAYVRLAPIQCTTWAHPITSGSPTIDYFLSSELMEPDDGNDHYTEKLVPLPNLGFSLPTVSLPKLNKTRADFQLGENRIIYLCTQSLFKYLPQHDWILPKIAQANHRSQFVFVDPVQGPIITDCFKQRLAARFSEFQLNYEDYCMFLPRLHNTDFMMINQLGDIFLDCLSWSGGLTTRHAIACGLPIVTYPGQLMRSRHSFAMLQMMGVTETIAESEENYVDIAIRLGIDDQWRCRIRNRMTANQERLFNDQVCITALESFLENAIKARGSTG